ncbi:unnamed protein product [Thelazia callipaeda]|uniref:DH domain-containing protein n=1 Tax=Thelazia callipaeda TaxID=103827 RepID=A0A0N5DAP6_THECL|nr:unnamed protein product [Thelazia callipaeda]
MVNVGESSRHDDQKYRTTEHSQVYEWNTARRSISSTFASGTDISPAMASTSAQHEKLIQSTPDLRNKRIAAMFSIESSDSGAITLSDGDCKPFRLVRQQKAKSSSYDSSSYFERESVQKQTLNSENTISEESVREQCCTTQYDSFFMPKGTKVKCYHVLRDITMLEYSTLIELSILIELYSIALQDFYAIFPEKAISSARVLTDLFEELRDLECFHSGYLSTLQILLQKWSAFLGCLLLLKRSMKVSCLTLSALYFS